MKAKTDPHKFTIDIMWGVVRHLWDKFHEHCLKYGQVVIIFVFFLPQTPKQLKMVKSQI